MAISGTIDRSIQIQNDINNHKWILSGVYEEQTGIFFFREGEEALVQQHFKLMNLNRL